MPGSKTTTRHFFPVVFSRLLSCLGWYPAATSSSAFTFCLSMFPHLARSLQQTLSSKGLLTQGKETHLFHIPGRLFSSRHLYLF